MADSVNKRKKTRKLWDESFEKFKYLYTFLKDNISPHLDKYRALRKKLQEELKLEIIRYRDEDKIGYKDIIKKLEEAGKIGSEEKDIKRIDDAYIRFEIEERLSLYRRLTTYYVKFTKLKSEMENYSFIIESLSDCVERLEDDERNLEKGKGGKQ